MTSATEEELARESERRAMERDLEAIHRRLDEYEREVEAGYAAVAGNGRLEGKEGAIENVR
jgi:hypothetical protein